MPSISPLIPFDCSHICTWCVKGWGQWDAPPLVWDVYDDGFNSPPRATFTVCPAHPRAIKWQRWLTFHCIWIFRIGPWGLFFWFQSAATASIAPIGSSWNELRGTNFRICLYTKLLDTFNLQHMQPGPILGQHKLSVFNSLWYWIVLLYPLNHRWICSLNAEGSFCMLISYISSVH